MMNTHWLCTHTDYVHTLLMYTSLDSLVRTKSWWTHTHYVHTLIMYTHLLCTHTHYTYEIIMYTYESSDLYIPWYAQRHDEHTLIMYTHWLCTHTHYVHTLTMYIHSLHIWDHQYTYESSDLEITSHERCHDEHTLIMYTHWLCTHSRHVHTLIMYTLSFYIWDHQYTYWSWDLEITSHELIIVCVHNVCEYIMTSFVRGNLKISWSK